ncbi:MAG: macro domain-containing protein [Erysipelotrichaceae bacterium]|nr:macro domain-containing protein [Erysipelotrichaceae bacterium]
MPLEISRNDIRNMTADAIVCPTDEFLSGSGGVDKAIHELAGKRLDEACAAIGNLPTGQAVLTSPYDLKEYRYIIHTCGPDYTDGEHDEVPLLASCYRECLNIAKEKRLESIVFPLISSGSFSFPKGQALKTATDAITEFLLDNEMNVYLLVYDKESFDTAGRLYTDVRNYLDQKLNPPLLQSSYHLRKKEKKSSYFTGTAQGIPEDAFYRADEETSFEAAVPKIEYQKEYKKEELFEPDESFSECLIRMIDERGLLDPEVYKKANIDRKHFNHIKNTKNYRPKKKTAVALAIGMKLNIRDTNTLLERAGYVLTSASKFDLIIRYCIEKKIYNIFDVNELLFAHDQETLGC